MNTKQFRIMRGLHEMKKAQQALLRYLNLDLVTTIESFKGFINDESSKSVTLPFQPNLDFILLRFQGLSMLLLRTVGCLKKCAKYFLGFIKAGSFYSKGIVFLSTLATVWCHSRDICKTLVTHYNRLRGFREYLQVKPGERWTDQPYELPEKLQLWMGEDWTNVIANETYDDKLLLREADIESFSNRRDEVSGALSRMKIESDDAGEASNLEVVRVELLQPNSVVKNELELEDDAPIPRTKTVTGTVPKTFDHSISKLRCKESIKAFIKHETRYRKVDALKSLTINKMRNKSWKEFKEDIQNKAVLMQESALVTYVQDYLEDYKLEESK